MKYILTSILTFIVLFSIVGCRTIASRKELVDGILIEVERMELRGVGKNEADFKNKKISNDSGFKVPNVEIDVDKLR